jgi:DNA-binding transcriptional ArsR family regulator
MFAAIGTEPRLRIMRLLLSAHPDGLVVGDIQSELSIPASTLSHHLDKLKNEGLVEVRREGTYLWYSANTVVLQTAFIVSLRRVLYPEPGHPSGNDCFDLEVDHSEAVPRRPSRRLALPPDYREKTAWTSKKL